MKDKISAIKPTKDTLLVYLFIGTLIYRIMPYLLNVTILLITKRPIHPVIYQLAGLSGLLVLPFGAIVLWRTLGYESKMEAVSGAMLIGFAEIISSVGGTLLQEKILVYLLDYIIIYYILCILLQLVYTMIILLALPRKARGIKNIAIIFGISMLKVIVLFLVDWFFGAISGVIQLSFGTNVLLRAIGAIIDSYALYALFIYGHTETQEQKPPVKNRWKVHLLVACIGIIICMATKSLVLWETPEERIHATIAEDIAMGSAELALGNVETASAYYNNALERKSVWEYAAGISEDGDSFRNAEQSLLFETRYLYWQYNNNVRAMEQCILDEDVDIDFAIELLSFYAKQDTLSAKSEAIQKDIISLMIANDSFTDTVVSLDDLENREYKLAKRLDEIDEIEIYCKAVNLLAKTGKAGGINQQQAEEMLTIAEERPDDMSLQYFAVAYGCAYKSDNATHYGRTLQAAERFIALYEAMDGITVTQIYQGRMQLVEWAVELGRYEDAITYIENALEIQESEALLVTLAQCQYDLDKVTECHETAQRILEINPANYGAMYYSAVAKLRTGDVDGSIEDTIQLCEVVCSLEAKEQHQAEVMLYDVLQYQSFNDLTYKYMVYRKLTEEQRKRIEENDFYAAYLDAVYCCFSSKEYDKALERIEYVLSKEPDLSQANYLKGCIYFGVEDFEKAAAAFEKAIAIDDTAATAWYSLANAYDALGKYEEAYEACIRVDSLLPDTDHLFDPYGIAIHNNYLKKQLKAELEGKGE